MGSIRSGFFDPLGCWVVILARMNDHLPLLLVPVLWASAFVCSVSLEVMMGFYGEKPAIFRVHFGDLHTCIILEKFTHLIELGMDIIPIN